MVPGIKIVITRVFRDAALAFSSLTPKRLHKTTEGFSHLIHQGGITVSTPHLSDAAKGIGVISVLKLDGDLITKVTKQALDNEELITAHLVALEREIAPIVAGSAVVRTIRRLTWLITAAATADPFIKIVSLGREGFIQYTNRIVIAISIVTFIVILRLSFSLWLRRRFNIKAIGK